MRNSHKRAHWRSSVKSIHFSGIIAELTTPRQDPRQESSSVRQYGQRLYGELHRLSDNGTIFSFQVNCQVSSYVGMFHNRKVWMSGYSPLVVVLNVLRHNAAMLPEGKKTVPARIATVGGKTKQAKQPGQVPCAVLP